MAAAAGTAIDDPVVAQTPAPIPTETTVCPSGAQVSTSIMRACFAVPSRGPASLVIVPGLKARLGAGPVRLAGLDKAHLPTDTDGTPP